MSTKDLKKKLQKWLLLKKEADKLEGKLVIMPATMSTPIIQNVPKASTSPKEMNEPLVVNTYKSSSNMMAVKDILKALKRKRHGS